MPISLSCRSSLCRSSFSWCCTSHKLRISACHQTEGGECLLHAWTRAHHLRTHTHTCTSRVRVCAPHVSAGFKAATHAFPMLPYPPRAAWLTVAVHDTYTHCLAAMGTLRACSKLLIATSLYRAATAHYRHSVKCTFAFL